MPETKKTYALWPGMVTSKSDGQRHYITASKLAVLYGVRLDECVILDMREMQRLPASLAESRVRAAKGLVDLYPRYGGDYTLPAS